MFVVSYESRVDRKRYDCSSHTNYQDAKEQLFRLNLLELQIEEKDTFNIEPTREGE